MSFLKKKTQKESLHIMGCLIQVCCKKGGHICKRFNKMFKKRDYLGIVDYEFDYSHLPIDTNDILYARQIQALFSKQDFLDFGIDKEAVSFRTFMQSESQCRDTNHRFRAQIPPVNPDVTQVMYLAQYKIGQILEQVPDIANLHFSFGPGSNTSTKKTEVNPRIKLSSSLECSANFAPFASRFLEEFPNWQAEHLIQGYSKEQPYVSVAPGELSFVPKSSKTLRAIIVEPILNGFYQKAIGSYIKERLKLAGLDLRRQHPNQKAAELGSLGADLATVDLSNASDTISYGLVLSLLPVRWFHLLDIGRSGVVKYKDKEIYLEKFSSMGNAYTFELESLIFFALATAVCELMSLDQSYVRSYGDDIVIPVAAIPLLLDTFSYCGFKVNTKKSYWEGPFRESCGADYLFGYDIRPFYLRDQISERVLYLMHNWFIRHLELELAETVAKFVNPELVLYGPDGYGDGHLIGPFVLRQSRKRIRQGYCGGVFDTYALKKRINKKRYPGDWIFPCYSIYVKTSNEEDLDEDPELREFKCSEGFDVFDESVETDPNVIKGSRGFRKLSIYTLATTIFGRVGQRRKTTR